MWSRTVLFGWCCYQGIIFSDLVVHFIVSILISQHDQQDLRSRCEGKLRLGFSSNFNAAALQLSLVAHWDTIYTCTYTIYFKYIIYY
jgi:hypothetical protein